MRTGANRGVTLLLVEKASSENNDSHWAAVDATKRVQMVDLKQQDIYRARAARGTRYDDAPALNAEDRRA
eukprot:10504285-Lingulodinium_polyedra.AAC.1